MKIYTYNQLLSSTCGCSSVLHYREHHQYVVESRFQKPDYKKPRENTLLNNRIGNYLTSDFADLPSVDADNIIDTEYDCTAAGKEENNAAKN